MTALRSDFLRVLQTRGFIHDCTDLDGLDAACAAGTISGYIGFDATASSLHVGSLLPIMMLRWLQQTGHRPIVLLGGGTTRIGDPSGKDTSRQLLTDTVIEANIQGIRRNFEPFLTFGRGRTDALLVNNADWLDDLPYIPFLRDVGRHFTLNRMLSFDSVRLRLEREQPLTFLEFNYMILQAYDFVTLSRRYGCVLQMGGSDQWGNIVNGVELSRRMRAGEAAERASGPPELFGLTTPLLTTATGAKMGKTADGAVWLDAAQCSPYDYYQYWRNCDDADVGRFLRLFTELPLDEVARLEALEGREINEAKKVLAEQATAMLHGTKAAREAADTARTTFEAGGSAAGLPTVALSPAELAAGADLLGLFVQAGLCASKGEVRRLIKGGGARLNDVPITDADARLKAGDLGKDGTAKLSAGKKHHALVKLAG